jgi:plasmid stabilization system protein ParE
LNFQVSKKALVQIEELYTYHAIRFNVSRAEKILKSIDIVFNNVKNNPKMYSKYNDCWSIERNIRRALVATKYNVIFEVFEDKILILYVFHVAMDQMSFKV